MSALIYLVDSLLLVALFFVLARLLLQWTRADFRNPLCQAVVRLTNPLILPLRRVLPPIDQRCGARSTRVGCDRVARYQWSQQRHG